MAEEKTKIELLAQLVENAQDNLIQAKTLLKDLGVEDLKKLSVATKAKEIGEVSNEGQSTVIEGVFDGLTMIGPDGKTYSVPANYVSKSKLLEGDLLKLTIKPDGSFVYKQIGPVQRKRQVGTLIYDESEDQYRVQVGQKSYKVVTAAVTYYKGAVGDEVVILIAADGSSHQAAVENIIKQGAGRPLLETGAEAELTAGSEAELPSGGDDLLKNPLLEEID